MTATRTAGGIARAAVDEYGALQKPAELAEFLVVLTGELARVIVEIGSDAGGTLWAWQQIPGIEQVISVSLPMGSFATARALDPHGAAVLRRDSHDPDTVTAVWQALGRRHADALFIDGDHTYEGCESDWEMYEPLVRPGGIVAFHDIVPHPDQPDVEMWRLWAEIPDVKHEIVTEPRTWGGIGWYRVSAR